MVSKRSRNSFGTGVEVVLKCARIVFVNGLDMVSKRLESVSKRSPNVFCLGLDMLPQWYEMVSN